ncbi:alpha/beta hydrolase [Aquabacterium sp.]|uniref:serine aminopeptidase domain-containing protein n=1 Tax=Aquabacterium sp. TaxID=1872578 RepID=UPI00199308C8|nr:alpha/beta hydrolase [Aquabacterium sp.]MBC7698922.1 alpha/beta hydrolase [Aquabacterium sp.]
MTEEHSLILGAEQHIVATLTQASPGSPTQNWCAVLTNSGVIPRSGPHRMNVHLARHFARMGIPSIRFDMSGLGDSRRATGSLPMVEQWVADTRAAMDEAQARLGCDRFFMVGFCSGAEVAHLTALADARLRGAVLWDFYAFPTRLSKLYKLAYRLRRAGVKGIARRFIAKVRPPTTAASHGESSARAPVNAYESLTSAPVTSREEYTQRFRTLVGQGVELFFYYSGGEPEWYAYRGQFHDMFKGEAFVQGVAFEQLALSDHLLTRQPAQQAFIQDVNRWLKERLLSRGLKP